MKAKYTIGLDYGTNSVRALVVNGAGRAETATPVWNYEPGTAQVILSRDPLLDQHFLRKHGTGRGLITVQSKKTNQTHA